MPIDTKIFLGLHLNKEWMTLLNHSKSWKNALLMNTNEAHIVVKGNQHYFGVFFNSELKLEELFQKEKVIKNQLQLYCPKLNLDRHRCYVFSQVFFV